MAQLKKVELNAFTLIETLVSMTLISTIVGISFMIFNMSSLNQASNSSYYLIADEIIQKMKIGEVSMKTQVLNSDNFLISIEVKEHAAIDKLNDITLKIFLDNKKIYQISHLVLEKN